MSYYDTAEGVDDYAKMAEGFDGREHVPVLQSLVPEGRKILELGMGPGVDLDMLAEHYEVVGSDQSQAFLDRYAQSHPDTELQLLDAVTIEIDQTFDGIYSNKVLHHLTEEDLTRSLVRQAEILRPGGIALHGIWAGDGSEYMHGLLHQFHDCDAFAARVPDALELIQCVPYAEMEEGDSLRIVLRRTSL